MSLYPAADRGGTGTMARVVTTTATILYETVLEGRMPVHTNRCATQPTRSPPVAHDPTPSEYMLRILCARWNKSFSSLPACESETLVKQAVMNPRTRLWGAAVAYALATEASRDHAAEYDDDIGGAVFKLRSNPGLDLVVTTADGTGPNPLQLGMVPVGAAAYRAHVVIYTGRRTRQLAQQPITDYYDLNNRIQVTVTLTPT